MRKRFTQGETYSSQDVCFSIVGALTPGPPRETQVRASRTTPLKNV